MIGWQAAYIIARKFGQSKRWPAAIFVYKAIIRASNSTDPRVYYQLGNAYNNHGEKNRAIESIKIAVEAESGNRNWLYRLGFLLEQNKQFVEAISIYDQLIRLDDSFAASYKRKSTCLMEIGKHSESVNELRTGFDRCPSNTDLADVLAQRLRNTGPRWQELEVLETIYPVVENDGDWNNRIADAYASMNKHEKAALHYSRANSILPGNSLTLFQEGKSWMQLGNAIEAKKAFSRAIEVDDRRESKIFGLGVFYQHFGAWEDAARAYAEQCEITPTSAELHYKLGLALERSYDWESAAQEYQVALHINSDQSKWLFRLGFVYERMSQWSKATECYKTIVEQELSKNEEAHYRLGYVLAKLNRAQEACESFIRIRSSVETKNDEPFPVTNVLIQRSSDESLEALLREPCRTRSLIEEFNASSNHEIGLCYDIGLELYKEGKFEDAIFYFGQINIFPDAHGIDTKRYGNDKELFQQMQYTSWTETLPVDEGVVFYESFHSESIGCNPLAIYRGLRESTKYSHLRHVWSVSPKAFIPVDVASDPNTVVIYRNSDAYRRYLATAKYLVSNVSFGSWFVRRKGQLYLNTWHGTPFKTLGKDIKSGYLEHTNVARNFLQATHVLSGNSHTTEVLTRNYDISHIWTAKIAETGYPRVDRTLNMSLAEKQSIKTRLGIPTEKHEKLTILYAPTWRGGLNTRHFDTQKLINDITRLQLLDANIVFRAHHYTEHLLKDVCLDITMVPSDIESNDLLAAVDILVTDYSSIAVDFLSKDCPIFFYTYDYDEYASQRGLYFTPEELPGIGCSTIDQLIGRLQKTINGEPLPDSKTLMERFCPVDDGRATERAIQFFMESSEAAVVDIGSGANRSILLHHSFIPNGITSSAQNLIGSLDPEEYSCTIVVAAEQTAADDLRIEKLRELPENVAIIGRTGRQLFTPEEKWIVERLNKHRGLSNERQWEVYRRSYEREFRRIFGAAQFDAIVEFEGYSVLWASILGCARAACEKSIYLHNDMNSEWTNRFPYLESLFGLYRFFDNMISVSPAINSENYAQLGARFGLGKSSFIDCINQINPDRVLELADEPLDSDIKAFIRPGSVCLATMGRLSREKDHVKLINAFDQIRRELSGSIDLQLVILGDGPLRNELANKISELCLGDHILLGGLRNNPFPLLRHSDAFVLSSNHEGQPMVLLEALVLGLRIISTDIIGTRFMLGDNGGLLVDNSVDGLVLGIRELCLENLDAPEFDRAGYVEKALAQFVKSVFKNSVSSGII